MNETMGKGRMHSPGMDWSLTPTVSANTQKRRKAEGIHQNWVLPTGFLRRRREKEVSSSGKNVAQIMAPEVQGEDQRDEKAAQMG